LVLINNGFPFELLNIDIDYW